MQQLSEKFKQQFASFLMPMADAEVYLIPDFILKENQQALQLSLEQKAAWRQEKIKLFGKEIDQPRLTAWYADAGKAYTYSGLTWQPLPWLEDLAALRTQLAEITGVSFNSVLLNQYRNGQDSMGWHADNEPELGQNPIIASISLGSSRAFAFKHRKYPDQKMKLILPAGSLLLMAGATQYYWLHQVPKSRKPLSIRLNLTFRCVF